MSKIEILVEGKNKPWHHFLKVCMEECEPRLTLQEARGMSYSDLMLYIAEHKNYNPTVKQATVFNRIDDAFKEIQASRTVEDLKKVWEKYEPLQKNPEFSKAVTLTKKLLEEQPELDLK